MNRDSSTPPCLVHTLGVERFTLGCLHSECVGERAYMALSSIVHDPCTVVPIQPVQPPPTTPHLSLSMTVKIAIVPDRRHKTKHGNPSFCLLSLDALFKRYCSDFRLEEQPAGRIKMTIHDSCDQASCPSCTFHARLCSRRPESMAQAFFFR